MAMTSYGTCQMSRSRTTATPLPSPSNSSGSMLRTALLIYPCSLSLCSNSSSPSTMTTTNSNNNGTTQLPPIGRVPPEIIVRSTINTDFRTPAPERPRRASCGFGCQTPGAAAVTVRSLWVYQEAHRRVVVLYDNRLEGQSLSHCNCKRRAVRRMNILEVCYYRWRKK